MFSGLVLRKHLVHRKPNKVIVKLSAFQQSKWKIHAYEIKLFRTASRKEGRVVRIRSQKINHRVRVYRSIDSLILSKKDIWTLDMYGVLLIPVTKAVSIKVEPWPNDDEDPSNLWYK